MTDAVREVGRLQDAFDILNESDPIEHGWVHLRCGTHLAASAVHHSVHTMPHALAGAGEVQTRTVPYCPSCYDKPSAYGSPITPSTTEWPKVALTPKVSS